MATPIATQNGMLLQTPSATNENDNQGLIKEHESNESDLSQQAQSNLLTPTAPVAGSNQGNLNGQTGQGNGLQQFNSVVVMGSLQNLKDAPSFSNSEIRNWQGQNWGQSISSFWNSQVAALPQTGAQLESNNLVEFQNLSGIAVTNSSNNQVGFVQDLVIDPQSNDISYVIVNSGVTAFGTYGRLVAVPFNLLTWQQSNYLPELQLPANAENLDNAPSVNSMNDINSLHGNSTVQQLVDDYWNGLGNPAASATPGTFAGTGTAVVPYPVHPGTVTPIVNATPTP